MLGPGLGLLSECRSAPGVQVLGLGSGPSSQLWHMEIMLHGQGLGTLVLQSQTMGARQEAVGSRTCIIPVAHGDNKIS